MVRCVRGGVYDVIIDLRQESPTFKHWTSVELTAENRKALYIPEGFAHGYLSLEDNTEMIYGMSEFYAPKFERGLRYNDPKINITWPHEIDESLMSVKDRNWPDFNPAILGV
jgi:dTDP-4-dehydrorhamnose 3,5-epimerase